MLCYKQDKWIDIQQRMQDANNYSYNPEKVTRFVIYDEEWFDLAFKNNEDETMFLLRWS
jgi:hypothetical protein